MRLIDHIYVYCTDFVISLANLLGLSYYEINFLLFIVLFPLALAVSFVVFLWQRRMWKKVAGR